MYINSFEELKKSVSANTTQTNRVIGATMKGRYGETGKFTKGSEIINWSENRVGELNNILQNVD